MVSRYKMARAKGRQYFEEALAEDQRLLASFGLDLLSVENGLRVVRKKGLRTGRINPWDILEVNPQIWGWLRPLLLELHELRKLREATVNPDYFTSV